jgi:hypothetical protein
MNNQETEALSQKCGVDYQSPFFGLILPWQGLNYLILPYPSLLRRGVGRECLIMVGAWNLDIGY